MTTVIKPGGAYELLSTAMPLHLSEHVAEANALVSRAREESERIVAEAKTIARRYYEESKRQGYSAAYREGFEQGTAAGRTSAFDDSTRRFTKDHASVVSAMKSAVDQIERTKTDLQIAANRDLLVFATRLAEKMTFVIGRDGREAAQENLKRAVRLVGELTNVTIRVNPADHETMRVFAPTVFKQMRDAVHIEVVADESVSAGGCVVRTERTEVDATLETQVAVMVQTILGRGNTDG